METAKKTQLILRDRARILAQEMVSDKGNNDTFEATTFRLGEELYALESRWIREIVPLRGHTPLPCVPPHIAGIMNFRGRMQSLLDLRRLFDLPGPGEGDGRIVIFISSAGTEFGVLVDEISGVVEVDPGALQPEMATLTGVRGQYLKGLVGNRLILLDAERLLTDSGLIVNEEVY